MVEKVHDGEPTAVIGLLVHEAEDVHEHHEDQGDVGDDSVEGPVVEGREDGEHACV